MQKQFRKKSCKNQCTEFIREKITTQKKSAKKRVHKKKYAK